MGYIGNPSHPEVVAAIEHAVGTICKGGKAAGVMCRDVEAAQRYAELGARFLGVGADTVLLSNASSALLARFRDGRS